MENMMALRGVRTWLLAAALSAACGGGDLPGGGNGDTDGGGTRDGTTGNGGRTDGHVPNPSNPLIQTMVGTWTFEWFEAEEDGEIIKRTVLDPPPTGPLVVDPSFPDCRDPIVAETNGSSGFCEGEAHGFGPPGDACICLRGIIREGHLPPVLILEGDIVRAHSGGLFLEHHDGRVLKDGQQILLHSYGDDTDITVTNSLRKLD